MELKEKFLPSAQQYIYHGATHKDNWTLVGEQKGKKGHIRKLYLPRADWVNFKPYTKVKGAKSPFDGDHAYWGKRLKTYPPLSSTQQTLLKRQNGVCPMCKRKFKTDDAMDVDHVVPKRLGGKDVMINFQLLHRYCHNEKTRQDNNLGKPKTKPRDRKNAGFQTQGRKQRAWFYGFNSGAG